MKFLVTSMWLKPKSCPLSSDCSASSSLALEPSSVLLIPVHPPLRMTVEIFCFSFWSDSTDHMEKLRCKIQHFHLMEVLKRTRGPQELRVWGLGETFEYQHQQKILHMKVLFWSNTFSSLQREEVHVWFVFLVWELQVEGRIWALDQSCNEKRRFFEHSGEGLLILDPWFCSYFWGKLQANLHGLV